MPSKPRHGRDYRKRTAPNRNVIQVPGADQGYVRVIQVNYIGTNQLSWLLDAKLDSCIDGTQLGVIANADAATYTGDSPDIHNYSGSVSPSSVDAAGGGAVPGTTIINVTYPVDPDPATWLWIIRANETADPSFVERMLNVEQLGSIATP